MGRKNSDSDFDLARRTNYISFSFSIFEIKKKELPFYIAALTLVFSLSTLVNYYNPNFALTSAVMSIALSPINTIVPLCDDLSRIYVKPFS